MSELLTMWNSELDRSGGKQGVALAALAERIDEGLDETRRLLRKFGRVELPRSVERQAHDAGRTASLTRKGERSE